MCKRILIGLLLAVIYLAALLLGAMLQTVLFTVAALIAVHEMHRVFLAKGHSVFTFPAYIFPILMACILLFVPRLPWTPLWFACVLATVIERVCNRNRSMEECFAALFILIYPLLFFVSLLLLCGMDKATSTTALLTVAACPLMGDTLAFFIGTFFGKHKLCPAISPKKTVEGSIASFFGSLGAGALLYGLQGYWYSEVPLLLLLSLGGICGILGQIGDLFASTIKRWADVKDYGMIFPGHGGVLDRLDSVLLCAPAVYAGFAYIFT